MRQRVVQRMAHVVVPYRTRVTATLYDCDPPAEQFCKAGVANLARSRYDAALADYDRAMAALKRVKTAKRGDVAEIHWNKAIIYKYSRRFQQALAELDAALALDPGNGTYIRERKAVFDERARHSQLIEQGLGAPGS